VKDHVPTNLSLPPLARAALQVLSELDADSATGTAVRLLREEMQLLAPGVWEEASLSESAAVAATPEERAAAYATALRKSLRAVLPAAPSLAAISASASP
jgi:hypothetical protein